MLLTSDTRRSLGTAAGPRSWFWVEYLLDGLELALFMLAACAVVVLLEYPASPLRQALPSAPLRRSITGVAMGLTAMGLIYSPWGKRSGAHMNPAVTLAFLRLGKIQPRHAALYVLAQFLGASLGMGVATAAFGDVIADASVAFVVTEPRPGRALEAFCAEVGISALLMLVVLVTSGSARLRSLTGVFCGLLVALYITLEAPLSGMSMNPARTFGSALVAGRFEHLWLYLLAPPLGMGLVAEAFARLPRAWPERCAKLHHSTRVPCIFCTARSGEEPSQA